MPISLLREQHLALCRPVGLLNAELVEWLLIYTSKLENAAAEPFNRFIDLSDLLEIKLSHAELCEIAQARRYALQHVAPFRTAILAPNALSAAVARMYEVLMDGGPAEIRVFRDADGAADWLQVPVQTLLQAESA